MSKLTELLADFQKLDAETQKALTDRIGKALAVIVGSQIAKRQVIKGCQGLGLDRDQGKGVWRLLAYGSYVVAANALTGYRTHETVKELQRQRDVGNIDPHA
jgi:hypothetical protein